MTAEEVAAVNALKRLAKRWPPTLLLMSMDGSLVVVHADDERLNSENREGVVLDRIVGIPSDGGGW